MNNRKNAESLIGIIIGIFILSFILIGMLNVVGFSKDISYNYENKIEQNLIQTNSKNIISKLDTDIIDTGEEFYIYKDNITKEFLMMTGPITKEYSLYIDKLGNNTSSGAEGKVFERKYKKQIDILRHVIYPPEIDNLIFHFDATNSGSFIYNNTGSLTIEQWNDLSGNNLHAHTDSNYPILKEDGLNNKPLVTFEGNKAFSINDDALINTDNAGSTGLNGLQYPEKSIAIVLKTGDNVQLPQTIYEEGGGRRGYSFVVDKGNIYAGIWNRSREAAGTDERDAGHYYKNVNLGEALPDTAYFITIVQDSTHGTDNTNFDDNQNKLQIFLNGNLTGSGVQNHVDPQVEHPDDIGMGAINHDTVRASDNTPVSGSGFSEHFKGGIGELISRNHALTIEEVRGVQNYFVDKWLGGVESVRHNIIETDVSLIKK